MNQMYINSYMKSYIVFHEFILCLFVYDFAMNSYFKFSHMIRWYKFIY